MMLISDLLVNVAANQEIMSFMDEMSKFTLKMSLSNPNVAKPILTIFSRPLSGCDVTNSK